MQGLCVMHKAISPTLNGLYHDLGLLNTETILYLLHNAVIGGFILSSSPPYAQKERWRLVPNAISARKRARDTSRKSRSGMRVAAVAGKMRPESPLHNMYNAHLAKDACFEVFRGQAIIRNATLH